MSYPTRRRKLCAQSRQFHREDLGKGFVLLWMLWYLSDVLLNTRPQAGSRDGMELMWMKKKLAYELDHFPHQIELSWLGLDSHHRKNVSVDRREAKIAFFLQVSESNVILVPRLLSRIWHPDNIYCLHIDTKTSPHAKKTFEDALTKNESFKNIFLLESTVVTYAGISMILNTLDSIQALLNQNQSWDYFINLSGSDYPLVSPIGIRRLLGQGLAITNQPSFIHFSSSRSSWDRVLRHRLRFLHFDPALGFDPHMKKELIQTFTRHPVVSSKDISITIPKGEAWIIAHRSFCEEVITGTLSRRLLALFANMQSPPEHFFQTVAWNHPRFNYTTARNAFRFVRWKSAEGKPSRQHPVYLDDQSKSGKWLYWDSIKASKDIFARKFRVPNSLLMGHIDKYVSGMGENRTDTFSTEIFFQRVERRLRCVISHTITRQRSSAYCRSQKRAFEVPDPPPSVPAKPEEM